ncbi:MAG: hypothetical protein AB1461_11260 [Thermodesulfobacteriota bacterium]
MAVNEITGTNPIPPEVQRVQSADAGGEAPVRLSSANQARAAEAVTQAVDPVLQNELLINQTLRTLNSVLSRPANSPLINVTPPPLADPEASKLDIILQNQLLINQALQNLGFVSRPRTDTLLLNAIPPQLEAEGILENLDAVQQNELLINQALANVTAPAPAITSPEEAEITATLTIAAPAALTAALQEAELAPAAAATVAVAATAASVLTLAPGEALTVLTPTPIAATFVTPQAATLPVPFFVLNPDRTPYVLAVHEIRNPNPPPGEPAPIPTEVRPPLPAGRARPVGRAALRQAWASYQARVLEENIPPAIPPAERDLRHVLTRVNADLSANGLPLHLVFARHEGGYALNVYDCSDNELCRLTRDVPLKFEELTATLDNLQHETGIIINTSS